MTSPRKIGQKTTRALTEKEKIPEATQKSERFDVKGHLAETVVTDANIAVIVRVTALKLAASNIINVVTADTTEIAIEKTDTEGVGRPQKTAVNANTLVVTDGKSKF